MQNPTILAIDTSCDETSVAVTKGLVVWSNVIASQVELHKEYGGVFPTVAKQAHKENIAPSIELALKRAGIGWAEVDAIAVTQGPGLAPALEIGIKKAIELAETYDKPLIAVNHIEGHVLSVLAERRRKIAGSSPSGVTSLQIPAQFPVLAIIVSGGHTEFILVEEIGKYKRLGWTIDDAAGEALDKIGRMLDLGYPAGGVIEQFAKHGDLNKYQFPLPMTSSHDYNLSFSGMKTFARRLIERTESQHPLSKQDIYDFCASLQYAVFRHITHKLNKILHDYQNLGQVWLGGGVAANINLRATIRQTLKEVAQPQPLLLKTPYSKKICGDNAAMIGVVAYFKFIKQEFVTNPKNLDRKPRWKIDLV